jgi:hypothetical protein
VVLGPRRRGANRGGAAAFAGFGRRAFVPVKLKPFR